MFERYLKIIVYALLISIILADIIIYTWLFGIIFNWGSTVTAGVIGFVGALLGGTLTLLGVRLTIIAHKRKERLEKLPKKINNSWKIQNQLTFVLGLSVASKENNKDIEKLVSQFYEENWIWVTELSVETDSKVYDIVDSYFTLIDDYSVYKVRGNSDQWFEEAYNLRSEMSNIIHLLEEEYRELDSKKGFFSLL